MYSVRGCDSLPQNDLYARNEDDVVVVGGSESRDEKRREEC